MGVITDFLKAELAAERFEICIVRVSQRHGQVHVIAATQTDFSFLGDEALIQSGKGDRKLDRRAGLGAAGERQFLIDHCQDAAAGGLDGDDCFIHSAQSVDGRFAHCGIFAGDHVAFSNILRERTGVETLVIAMPPAHTGGGSGHNSAAASQMAHAPSSVLSLADFL